MKKLLLLFVDFLFVDVFSIIVLYFIQKVPTFACTVHIKRTNANSN